MSGSNEEPVVPLPDQAAEQIRDATGRLREQAWMVAPLTSMPQQPTSVDRDLGQASALDPPAARAPQGVARAASQRSAVPRVIRLPPDPASVAAARRFVTDCLQNWGLVERADDLLTVSDELVTNAVRHARSPITLAVGRRPDRLVVQVEDESPSPPLPNLAVAGTLADTGRGLLLVDELSLDWGTTTVEAGKRVWAELLAPPPR